MTAIPAESEMLPVLRPDLEIHPGPDAVNGAPTYVIHDPLGGTFEAATWVQAEILRRLRGPQTVDQLLRQLFERTTIRVSREEVTELCADATRKGLTIDSCVATQEPPAPRRIVGPAGLFRSLVFLRIPLLRPDAFLERTVAAVSVLASPVALGLYLIVSIVGVVFLAQRFDAYLATFPYFFNVAGALTFALAIMAVKSVHEFSHAYVAKALGNRVPVMGVALIFLFPVAYADVTDSWRMRSRRKRLLISLAGVLAELVCAGLALFVWGLSSPGPLKSVCFVVSSVTLLSTLIVNLNPAMRFDGYYVLSDLLGIDNLQTRAFAALRWLLRRHVLGMPVAHPEPDFSPRRLALLVGYAAGAWVYRLGLYTGIALMLYHRVTKTVGILLFLLALYTFLAKPVVGEMIRILRMRALLSWNPRTVGAAFLCGAGLLWVALPLPRWQAVPATTDAQARQIIYAPGDGVLRDVSVEPNARVNRGQTLFVLESRELEAQAEIARLDVQRIELELALIRGDESQRALLPQKTEELARAGARLETIHAALEANRVVAEVDGVVAEWDESLRAGTPIGVKQVLGKIIDARAPRVVAYVRHDLVPDVAVGSSVYFCSDARPGRLSGVVTFIKPVRTTFLEHRGLSSLAGGDIAVTMDSLKRLEVMDSYYEVEIALDEPPAALRIGQTGQVWLRSAPRSRLMNWLRSGYRVLVRESNL